MGRIWEDEGGEENDQNILHEKILIENFNLFTKISKLAQIYYKYTINIKKFPDRVEGED